MAEKRRDNKGRILRTGESQRKDGRYAYKYTDSTGKPQFVYAWKLVATDKTPAGKRDDISLREKEKEINRDIADGIDTVGKKMTVCQLYAKQNSQRADVKRGTKKQREYLMGLLRDDPLGGKSIDAVKPSDAKEWAIRMREKGFSFQSISNYKRSLRAAFFIAIEDDCIRKNPFSFALNKVLEDDSGRPVGWALFRELKGYLTLELECSGYDDHGVFKLEHKLKDLLDTAVAYAGAQGFTALRNGMSSVGFNIDGKPLEDIPEAMRSLSTERVDYHWMLDYGFRVVGIQPNVYRNNCHLILLVKEL